LEGKKKEERRNKEKRDDGDQHTLGTLNPRIRKPLKYEALKNDEKASLSLAVVWLSQTK